MSSVSSCCLDAPLLNDFHSQTNPGCCAALRSPRPGPVLGASTHSLIKPSAQVCQGVILITPPLTWLSYCDFDQKRLFAGLSHRVILKHAETGRTQTYSTGSDVLAQQFAQRVRHLLKWMSRAQYDKGNGHTHCFVCRCPCYLMDADQEKSSALTYGSGVAGITTGRPVASIRSRPSPPCASCRMRTTCLLLTCWARSGLVHVFSWLRTVVRGKCVVDKVNVRGFTE